MNFPVFNALRRSSPRHSIDFRIYCSFFFLLSFFRFACVIDETHYSAMIRSFSLNSQMNLQLPHFISFVSRFFVGSFVSFAELNGADVTNSIDQYSANTIEHDRLLENAYTLLLSKLINRIITTFSILSPNGGQQQHHRRILSE